MEFSKTNLFFQTRVYVLQAHTASFNHFKQAAMLLKDSEMEDSWSYRSWLFLRAMNSALEAGLLDDALEMYQFAHTKPIDGYYNDEFLRLLRIANDKIKDKNR